MPLSRPTAADVGRLVVVYRVTKHPPLREMLLGRVTSVEGSRVAFDRFLFGNDDPSVIAAACNYPVGDVWLLPEPLPETPTSTAAPSPETSLSFGRKALVRRLEKKVDALNALAERANVTDAARTHLLGKACGVLLALSLVRVKKKLRKEIG